MQDFVSLGLSPVARDHADAATILRLSTAARDRTAIRLTYRSAAGEVTERLVDPYGVAFQSGHWYLVSWDHYRSAMRTFRLDRMLATEAMTDTFQRPENFDVVAYLRPGDRGGGVRNALRGPALASPSRRRGVAFHRPTARSRRLKKARCSASAQTTSTGRPRIWPALSATWWFCTPPSFARRCARLRDGCERQLAVRSAVAPVFCLVQGDPVIHQRTNAQCS